MVPLVVGRAAEDVRTQAGLSPVMSTLADALEYSSCSTRHFKNILSTVDTMLESPAKVAQPGLARKILTRVLSILIAAALIACVTNFLTYLSNRQSGPAGFMRGVVHGALMPCALPSLLVGKNVPIYATQNTGRTYNLGYTVGVNGCGAIFFGALFVRLSRLRRRRAPSRE